MDKELKLLKHLIHQMSESGKKLRRKKKRFLLSLCSNCFVLDVNLHRALPFSLVFNSGYKEWLLQLFLYSAS